jgi:hypothetical protein
MIMQELSYETLTQRAKKIAFCKISFTSVHDFQNRQLTTQLSKLGADAKKAQIYCSSSWSTPVLGNLECFQQLSTHGGCNLLHICQW